MLGTEIYVDHAKAGSSKKLTCPICGDASVTFNSRTTVSLRGTVEWLAIFTCTESHAFFIPMTITPSLGSKLDGVRSQSLAETQILVRDRIERVRSTVLSATALVDASRHLVQNIRRTRLKWLSRQRSGLDNSISYAETIH